MSDLQDEIDLKKDNPWNLPNWENPSEYPDPKNAEDWFWKWEFLRRNPSYRDLWIEYQNNRSEWEKPDEQGVSRAIHEAKRFDLHKLMSPAIRADNINYFEKCVLSKIHELCDVSPAYNDMSDFCERAHEKGQFLVSITPTERLEEQWKIIKKKIKEEFEVWEEEIKTWNKEFSSLDIEWPKSRQRRQEFLLYLRLLDAREEPCPTWGQITDTLSKEKEYANREPRSFQKSHRQARRLASSERTLLDDE